MTSAESTTVQPVAQAMTPDLQALTVKGEGSFTLMLADGSMLEVERIVRRVPGKRLVCQAIWQQQPVFAKIFLGSRSRRHAERDRQGSQWLVDKGLATPPLLHAAALPGVAGQALVYQAIVGSDNAENVLRRLAGKDQRLIFALALTRVVADHHAAGLLQTDLYLKNFLVQGDLIHTLDGDGIRRLAGWSVHNRALSNLARLWSKFDAADDDWLPQLYQAYCERRGWAPRSVQLKLLACEVRHIRHEVNSEYANRKVFRTCSDVHVEQGPTRFLAVAREWVDRLGGLLADPDKLVEEGIRLKTGNTCTVGLVTHAGCKIVVKRYNIKSLRHGLGRALRRSRAARSWSNAHRLRIADIATAQPVAMLEQRWGIFRRRAWFLAEYVEGPDVAEWMAQASPVQRRQVALNIARLLRKMQRLQLAHGDFKATNIKIVDMHPVLLDLDSLKEYRCGWLFRQRHNRDLRRLLKNWDEDGDVREEMRQALHSIYGNDPALAGITRD